MDRFLKIVLYAIPALAFAGLVVFVFNPQFADTGTRGLLNDKIRASGDFPCPDYDSIREDILSGGPPKDGIPAISDGVYVDADEATLGDHEMVFGINYDGFTAAYPESIMVWHEIVNEVVNNQLISITYCPLTRSAIGFIGYNLGVSGQLYNSNLIMYDRKTQSLIPQILGVAIDGQLCGTHLPTFQVKATTWGNWRERHPKTIVLTDETGYNRDYKQDPYGDYQTTGAILFPLTATSDALPDKSLVLGLNAGNESTAVPVDGFKEKHPEGVSFLLDDHPVTVWYDSDLDTLRANPEVRQMAVYWFAWYAQFPDTTIHP